MGPQRHNRIRHRRAPLSPEFADELVVGIGFARDMFAQGFHPPR
jgi:hypothetical protein